MFMFKKRDLRPLQIINNYGPKHQQEILRGEHEELQEAIDKVGVRKGCELYNYQKEMIIDEVADVLVMLLEYIQYYELPKKWIKDRVNFKLNRQLYERIPRENGNKNSK